MNKLLRNKKNICRALLALAVVMLFTVMFALPAMAEEGEAAPAAAEAAADNTLGMKALAAGLAVGKVRRRHRPLARGRGQDPHHPYAGPGVHRDRHHIRPSGGHTYHLRTLRQV